MPEHQRPPTGREILDACQISSTSVVAYNLYALERKGYILVEPGLGRGIRLVLANGEPCPFCGR